MASRAEEELTSIESFGSVIFHTCSYRCPWCEMPATSVFMSRDFPIKSMGGCGSGTVGRYMAEWWNSAAASEQGSSGLGRGPLSLAEQGSSFLWFGIIGFHLQQHHLSQINRVDPLWAFWFWAVGEAPSVWGPRPFTYEYTYIYIFGMHLNGARATGTRGVLFTVVSWFQLHWSAMVCQTCPGNGTADRNGLALSDFQATSIPCADYTGFQ